MWIEAVIAATGAIAAVKAQEKGNTKQRLLRPLELPMWEPKLITKQEKCEGCGSREWINNTCAYCRSTRGEVWKEQ